jgi:alpha-L-rhamnosidase
MYYSTLLQAANIGDVIGDSSSSDNWRKIAEKVKQAINSNLYLGDEHRYISSIFEDEIVQPTTHAQAFALAYEIVLAEDIQLVAGSLLDLISHDPKTPDFEVYGTYWVLEALGRAGLIDEALQIIRTYYGYWLDLGATTTWEIYNANQSYTQSLSHGWGTSPTWFLSTYLLGARQAGPSSWSLTPSFSDIETLQGSIPLSDGSLQIDWEQKSCGDISLEISSPENTNGTIWIDSAGRNFEIIMNGTPIWDGISSLVEWIKVDPQVIQIPVAGGNQNISFHRDC